MLSDSPFFFSSSPYVSSVVACIGISLSRNTLSTPAAQIPAITFQIVIKLSANALRTSPRTGSCRSEIRGMAAYAISRPLGKRLENDDGRFFLSSFWRIVDEMAIPHVSANERRNEKKARAAALRETGRGASIGNTGEGY